MKSIEQIPGLVLAGDIGGTRCRFVIGEVGLEGRNFFAVRDNIITFDTPEYPEVLESLLPNVIGERTLAAACVAVAGQMNDGLMVGAGQLLTMGYVGKNLLNDISKVSGLQSEVVDVPNDMKAAAIAEKHANVKTGIRGDTVLYTLSTGFGGSLIKPDAGEDGVSIIPDEPGHQHLRDGAICGCGKDGCLEAWVSGSGIEANRDLRGEDIPYGHQVWREVIADLTEGVGIALDRYRTEYEMNVRTIAFMGSVARGGQGGNLLSRLQRGLWSNGRKVTVKPASYGDYSGIIGAYLRASELASAA